MHRAIEAYRRLRGLSWPADYPIAQFPNPPLLIGLAALGLSYPTGGAVHAACVATAYVFIGVWAYLELTEGVNPFRRLLGAAGLVYVVVAIAHRIGA